MCKDWLNNYILQVLNKSLNEPNVQDFKKLIKNNLPQKLYRYRPLTEDIANINGIGRIKADLEIINLENSVMYLSSPEVFNDPYDSKPLINPYKLFDLLVKSEKVCRLYKINIEDYIKQNKNGIYEYTDDFLFKMKNWINAYSTLFNHCTSVLRIGCLTQNDHTNILMWSHYASQHTGYCVEYEIDTKL